MRGSSSLLGSVEVPRSLLQAPTVLASSNRFGRKLLLLWCCLHVAVANSSTIFAPNFLVYCALRFLSALGLSGIILTATTLCESRRVGKTGSQATVCGPQLHASAFQWWSGTQPDG